MQPLDTGGLNAPGRGTGVQLTKTAGGLGDGIFDDPWVTSIPGPGEDFTGLAAELARACEHPRDEEASRLCLVNRPALERMLKTPLPLQLNGTPDAALPTGCFDQRPD